MPIGIINDDDFQRELDRLSPRSPSGSIIGPPSVAFNDITPKGRKEGDVNVPDSLRKIIGEEAIVNGRESALGLAKEFGISPSSVSAYSNGATSTTSYNNPSKDILSHINKAKQNRINKASSIMSKALKAITQDKLDYTDARDLSGIAKDMSVIIKNLEPKQETDNSNTVNGPQFVIYAPQFKKEESFDVIQVTE